MVAALFAGADAAHALPPVNGSNCSSNRVNNEGALECFIQGEEDANNGISSLTSWAAARTVKYSVAST
jgi:hypothetical protein